MCRFVYYQGNPLRVGQLLTEPEHSLIHQSFHSHERTEPLNGDGFGVGWYVDGEHVPAFFRSISPAWSNANLQEISRVTTSRRILAHVRAATPGTGVAEANCHPFRMGGLAFMHNGDLGGFPLYRRALLGDLSDEAFGAVRGTTDSEHFLALLWDAWVEKGRAGATGPEVSASDGGERLADAIETALDRVVNLRKASGARDGIYLNCLVTDGQDAVACRFTSGPPRDADTLYLHLGKRYACHGSTAVMVPCAGDQTSVLVSSEPLTTDEGWSPVAVGDLVLISGDQAVRSRSLPPF